MSWKDLWVTFVTSEEATVTKQGAVSTGAMLAIVVAVAVLVTGFSVTPAWAVYCEDDCGGSCGPWYNVQSPYCGGPCALQNRDCFSGCREQRVYCDGGYSHCTDCP